MGGEFGLTLLDNGGNPGFFDVRFWVCAKKLGFMGFYGGFGEFRYANLHKNTHLFRLMGRRG